MEKETLYKFFDGKASREEKEAVRIWLESSPENEQELFKEREFFDAMILSGSTKVAGMEKKSRPFYRTVLLEAIKIAAVFAITVASGTYFYKSEICKIGEAMNTITVPAGQRANLTLADGTNVWLNARSEMRYPAVFTGNKREITLDGEAYFEVTHNEDKPFVVQTNKCNVEVLGTKFNVSAYADEYVTTTTLVEGAVSISGKCIGEARILRPNEQLVLDQVSGDVEVKNVDVDYYTAWKDGMFRFRDVRLEEIMRVVERWYDMTVVYEDECVKDLHFGFNMSRLETIEPLLNIFELNGKIKITKEGKVLKIKRGR